MENKTRHLALVRVTPEILADTLFTGKTTNVTCIDGLPVGAIYRGAAFDPDTSCFFLYFEHETFPCVYPGAKVTAITPWFETNAD